tara:strand:+ start:147 stop:413 length:267 start_codon:yes stop_codon:yes gene_type:complete
MNNIIETTEKEFSVPGLETGIFTVIDNKLYSVWRHRLLNPTRIVPFGSEDISELNNEKWTLLFETLMDEYDMETATHLMNISVRYELD